MSASIRCPKCGCEVGEALAARVREELRGQLVAELAEKEAAVAAREGEALRRERAVEERVRAEVEAGAAKAAAAARAKAEAAVAVELESVRGELSKANADLGAAKRKELELRRERETLERAKADLELEVVRRLDEERRRIREEAKADAVAAQALRLKEKDAVIDGMKRTIDELKQKSEQGSQQLQGEVLETSLEEALRREFPTDVVEPVPKGVRGADVVQRVRLASGAVCGVVLWESKRTRSWADAWLPKLRDDQREMRAEVAALVTQALPRGAGPVSAIDGVWVASFPCFLGLAHLLRKGLVDVAAAHLHHDGHDAKMASLYDYLTGPGFRARVEGLLEPFLALKADLEAERRAMERLWAKREKQLDRAMRSTSGLYGDVEGIVGATLPAIERLALPSADDAAAPVSGEHVADHAADNLAGNLAHDVADDVAEPDATQRAGAAG